ncbi:MAG: quinone-interacting membrane-bound oxidoreductase complex subunit QmoC [Proteobacteria bacterium]|nr:quinone-interacting membrane-bound oxidoreductase complex subunit QmoC [Pseudomonadota bacterium]
MTLPVLIEPDLDFIAQISSDSGLNLKKCYQCATCSVACTISHDDRPFPRKEMIHAAWGLKDRLIANPDIWLCHNCGDCSTLCPRDARPGDVLNTLRKMSIKEYSKPAAMHRLFNDRRKLPWLFILPAMIIMTMGLVTGLMNLSPGGDRIVFAHFFPVPLIEMIFIPLSLGVTLVFFQGIRRFLKDMQATDARLGKTAPGPLDLKRFLITLITQLPAIIKHEQFSFCSENKGRKISHMMVAFSFTSLAFVAGAFVFALYVLNSHGPYDQINPVKILANVSGIALIAGSLLLIRERRANARQTNGYFDWYLLGLALFLGITGMLTQTFRLAEISWAAYSMYFIHLLFAFNLVAFLPYTKLAHLVYRTVAIAYYHYTIKEKLSPHS